MSRHIFYCRNCDEYTMKEVCPICGKKTFSTKPAKYSPEDKWGKYRRLAKEKAFSEMK